MATSQNGYPVITMYGDPILVPLRANGKSFAPVDGVRQGPVAFILNTLANWLDNNIEPMDPRQSWSFTPKTITGGDGKTYSNHASATAFDYNALKHGQGRSGTWTPDQIKRIDAYLRDVLLGAVRWGEHYSAPTKIDGMHFEIVVNETRALAIATQMQKLPIPSIPAPSPAKDDNDMADITSAQMDEIASRAADKVVAKLLNQNGGEAVWLRDPNDPGSVVNLRSVLMATLNAAQIAARIITK